MTTIPIDPTTLTPEIAENARRNGKIARLPRAARDMINRMLDDGLPYHIILDELGDAGQGINFQNLTNWKKGGYQDWIKNQEQAERLRLELETAIDLLKENPGIDSNLVIKACSMLGAIQLFTALKEHGAYAVKNMLLDKPEKYISLLNLICRIADTGLRYDKFNRSADALKELLAASIKADQGESSPEQKIEAPHADSPRWSPAQTPEPTNPNQADSSQFKVGKCFCYSPENKTDNQ